VKIVLVDVDEAPPIPDAEVEESEEEALSSEQADDLTLNAERD
jgi:hypothetical protein